MGKTNLGKWNVLVIYWHWKKSKSNCIMKISTSIENIKVNLSAAVLAIFLPK